MWYDSNYQYKFPSPTDKTSNVLGDVNEMFYILNGASGFYIDNSRQLVLGQSQNPTSMQYLYFNNYADYILVN